MQRNRGKQQNGTDQRSLQENQRYQGNISCKDGLNKRQKWHGPNRSRDIKKRWQENTEELYKKDLHDPDNHNAMITHLQPDILEWEVKWALGSITMNITMNKASGGDGIPVELFQILKDNAVKVLHSFKPTNLENSAIATGLEKFSFHSNSKERQCQRMLKLPHNCTHLTRQ